MALNGDALGLAMLAAVNAVGDKTDRTAVFRALGVAIVSHITANAIVTVTTATPGAMAGPATLAGSGAGTVS